jgi:hypothetical protein
MLSKPVSGKDLMLMQVVWLTEGEGIEKIRKQLRGHDDGVAHKHLFKEISEGRYTFDAFGEEMFDLAIEGGSNRELEDVFLRLYTYGAKGVYPESLEAIDFERAVRFLVFSRAIGELGTGYVPAMCEVVFNLAITRVKLDLYCGKVNLDWNEGIDWLDQWVKFPELDYLAISELALLAGMSEQSVHNNLSGLGNGSLQVIERYGKRTVLEIGRALDWLRERNGFIDTRIPNRTAGMVDVPVASDGSVFGPSCRQKKGFKVGPKGSEVYYENIGDALSALLVMDKPRWRRPNSKGIFGIVSGKSWQSLTREVWLNKF